MSNSENATQTIKQFERGYQDEIGRFLEFVYITDIGSKTMLAINAEDKWARELKEQVTEGAAERAALELCRAYEISYGSLDTLKEAVKAAVSDYYIKRTPILQQQENPYYETYLINFSVDVAAGMCEVLTSADESGECRIHRFPITKRYDRQALTELLYAASMQFNSDYVSPDHVHNLVSNAIDSIWYGMRSQGINKLRPKEALA